MAKEKEPGAGFDVTVIGLASLLHDEGVSAEQLAIRLDRMRYRSIVIPPVLVTVAVTLVSLFTYMIARSENNQVDVFLASGLGVIALLIAAMAIRLIQRARFRTHAEELELQIALDNLRQLIEKVAQFEEFRQLPPLEKFVIELRLAAADKVLRSASTMLPSGVTGGHVRPEFKK